MRRNFGSLNLAALDLQLDAASLLHLQQQQYHHHDALTCDLADLHVRDDDSDAVGFPIELVAQAADDHERAYSPSARRRKRSYSEHAPLPANHIASPTAVEMRSPTLPIITSSTSSSLDPRAYHHHAELHALRCLSLNLMLSSSLPGHSHVAVTAPQPSTSMPKLELELGGSCQPHSDRVATALLAARRTSLPRNMIQSA